MKRNIFIACLALVLCVSLSACSGGVTDAEFEEVLNENSRLENTVSSLESKAADLEKQLAEAKEKLSATPAPTPTPEPTPDPTPTPEPTPTPTPAPKTTISQDNALKTAKSYLNYTAFSYEGLVSQLEYKKYTHDDAVWAVDNCGADWNEQAVKMAKSYLDYSSFSRDGLIDQLEY